MKIILLAAGIGSRLRPLTQNVPKSLLKISNNETVLERTIKMINSKIESDIIIVTGFKSDKFNDLANKYKNCILINNPFFRVTNSIASLWFAKEYLNDEVIIINADVIVEEALFNKILKVDKFAAAFYDSSIGEHADYKVAEQQGRIVVMSKELREFSGEYIGVSKLSLEAAKILRIKIEAMMSDELINEWYETALVDMIFNDKLILSGVDVAEYEWTEIDNVNDLIKARKIIATEEKVQRK